MDLMTTALLGFAGLIGGFLVKLLTDEAEAWFPRLSKLLLQRAVRRLPVELQGRYLEEWASYLDDYPGELSRLFAACGLQGGARKIAFEKSGTMPHSVRGYVADASFAIVAYFLMCPAFLVFSYMVRRAGARPLLLSMTAKPGGIITGSYICLNVFEANADREARPCVRNNRTSHLLYETGVYLLPSLISVINGRCRLNVLTRHFWIVLRDYYWHGPSRSNR